MQRRRKRRAMRKHRRAVSIQRDNEETPRNSMTQQRTRERRTMPTPSPVASIGIRLAYNRYTQHPCWNRTLFPSITFRFKYTRRHASKFIPIRRLIESLLRIPRKGIAFVLRYRPSPKHQFYSSKKIPALRFASRHSNLTKLEISLPLRTRRYTISFAAKAKSK